MCHLTNKHNFRYIIQWSYGVTCWEIFSGGKVPYGGITPMSLLKMLQEGYRMEKPNNAACSQKTLSSQNQQ